VSRRPRDQRRRPSQQSFIQRYGYQIVSAIVIVAVADVGAYERFLIDTFADLPGVARMTSQFAMKTIKAAGPLPFRA
jgi:DNA-binding Lrp family transcriptional regulator